MQSEIYIHHHLGLGDHFMCHGIVKDYLRHYDKVFVFCKPRNETSISFMYNSFPQIKVLPFDDDDAVKYIKEHNITAYTRIGHENLRRNAPTLEDAFYSQAGVDIDFK